MTLDEITALPIPDRIRLVQAIWGSIVAEHPDPALTDEQRALFARRTAELDARPENVLTWEQIKARIEDAQGVALG